MEVILVSVGLLQVNISVFVSYTSCSTLHVLPDRDRCANTHGLKKKRKL